MPVLIYSLLRLVLFVVCAVVLALVGMGWMSVTVLLGARGTALIPVLAGTGMFELAFGVLLGLGLAL